MLLLALASTAPTLVTWVPPNESSRSWPHCRAITARPVSVTCLQFEKSMECNWGSFERARRARSVNGRLMRKRVRSLLEHGPLDNLEEEKCTKLVNGCGHGTGAIPQNGRVGDTSVSKSHDLELFTPFRYWENSIIGYCLVAWQLQWLDNWTSLWDGNYGIICKVETTKRERVNGWPMSRQLERIQVETVWRVSDRLMGN